MDKLKKWHRGNDAHHLLTGAAEEAEAVVQF